MKRNAKIVANDGDVRVTVIVKLVSASGALSTTEANYVIEYGASAIADAIRTIPYTSFNPCNTKIA